MTDGEMPAVRVGGQLKIRESDLQPPAMPVIVFRSDEQVGEQARDDLNASSDSPRAVRRSPLSIDGVV